jgi:hypothetical protein
MNCLRAVTTTMGTRRGKRDNLVGAGKWENAEGNSGATRPQRGEKRRMGAFLLYLMVDSWPWAPWHGPSVWT